jgi:hypothetical protein
MLGVEPGRRLDMVILTVVADGLVHPGLLCDLLPEQSEVKSLCPDVVTIK